MNREEITRLAQEAGFVGMDGEHGGLRRFAALVASAEREAIAKMVEPWLLHEYVEKIRKTKYEYRLRNELAIRAGLAKRKS